MPRVYRPLAMLIVLFYSIVAVHGLDGKILDSWTSKSGVCWLTDPRFLPLEIPAARVLGFGYNANTVSKEISVGRVEDHGQSLIVGLSQLRSASQVRSFLRFLPIVWAY